ncbi:MAG TPA: hypothetical protein VFF04_04890 [Candidatus Babeliales bacterium]|nr:hypothetical protein [Candidatus Babeliales bacterium]
MIKPGFLMLEFLLYFMLATMVTVLTLNWVMVTHVQTARCVRKTITADALAAAHGVLLRELRTAPVQTSSWKVISHNAIVWPAGNYDIGWYIQNNILKRYTGIYNSVSQTWHKRSVSIVAEDVSDITITPCYRDASNGVIRSVACRLKTLDGSYQKEYEVSLINGRFL